MSEPGPADDNLPAGADAAHASPADCAGRVLTAIRRIIRLADVDSRRLAADHQVTGPQLLCLLAVAEGDSITVKAIAEQIHVSPSTVVGILDRLETADLVRRERSERDRRLVHISATPAGLALAQNVPYPLRNALERAMGEIPPRQRQQITDYLERLVELLGGEGLATEGEEA